jgi:hypothetical protein
MKVKVKKYPTAFEFVFYGTELEIFDFFITMESNDNIFYIYPDFGSSWMLLKGLQYRDEVVYSYHTRIYVRIDENASEEFVRTLLFRLCDNSFGTSIKNHKIVFFSHLGSLIESGYFKDKIEEIEIVKE